jgi:hypothetical protein
MEVMLIAFLIHMRSKFPHGYLSFILQVQLSMLQVTPLISMACDVSSYNALLSGVGGAPHCDCAYVVVDDNEDGFHGMSVVQIHLLFSFQYGGITYACALVEWFKKIGDNPDKSTGMWIVEPELDADNE